MNSRFVSQYHGTLDIADGRHAVPAPVAGPGSTITVAQAVTVAHEIKQKHPAVDLILWPVSR